MLFSEFITSLFEKQDAVISVVQQQEYEFEKRSKSTIPIHQCFCGRHPKLRVHKVDGDKWYLNFVAYVECSCGCRSRFFSIDGEEYYKHLEKTGHSNTADDAVMFWNNLFKKRDKEEK